MIGERGAEKTVRGRGMIERRGMPEGSGLLSRSRLRCRHGTTMV